MSENKVRDGLRRENETLRARLEEAEATLRALAAGEVDAVVVEAERILTLDRPDVPYRLLVEQIPQAAASLTAEGEIIHPNRRFADLLSRPLQALRGTLLREYVVAESRPVLERLLREGCQGDKEAYAEITVRRDDATDVPLHVAVRTMREGAFGSCLVLTDLTTQRHYEELGRVTEALRRADRRKDEFVATLAHELRNPLAPIRNAVHVLKSAELGQSDLQWSRDVIDRQVNVMARLLEDLLDVSRISLHRLELRKEHIELSAVLDAALETSGPVIEASGHKLTVITPPQPVTLLADQVRLAQVFSNLLNNAAKYTEEGGDIRLTAKVEGRELVVSVTDTGIGIGPEMLPRLFEMFSQATPALARSQGGLGIGLALVKGLVELHGGSITAHSKGLGSGSEFVVRLPGVISA